MIEVSSTSRFIEAIAMAAIKSPHKRRQNVAAKSQRPKPPAKRGGRTGYRDEITKDTVEKLNRIVPDDDFKDFETISGPRW